MKGLLVALVIVLGAVVAGCGVGGVCVAGTRIACDCAGGGRGTQGCDSLGTGYDACTGCVIDNPYAGTWGKFYLGQCQLNPFGIDSGGAFGTNYPNCGGASVVVTGSVSADGKVTGQAVESRAGTYTLDGTCTTTTFCSGTARLPSMLDNLSFTMSRQ